MAHWYTQEGTLIETVSKAGGGDRNATLRDAKKLGLMPGFSAVSGLLNSDGLNRWKINLYVDAIFQKLQSMQVDASDPEEFEYFKSEALKEARVREFSAANEGTIIHNEIERFVKGDPDFDSKYEDKANLFLELTAEAMEIKRSDLVCLAIEAEFSDPRFGYGGMLDYIFGSKADRNIISYTDLKTKEIKEGKKYEPSDSNLMQLPAYLNGYNYNGVHEWMNGFSVPKGWRLPNDTMLIDVFIDRKRLDGGFHVMDDEEFSLADAKFKQLLTLWRLQNDHDPRKI